jgi:rubrerythrin
MERDGEAFYRELAAKSGDQGLKAILTMLADDEVKHYRALQEIQQGAGVGGEPVPMLATEVLRNARNVFAQMQGQTFSLDIGGRSYLSQIELYKKAQEIERQSRAFYEEKADEVQDPASRKLLLRIAGEENRHYFLLSHLIEFVSRPEAWIENAEFNHLDEY